MNQIKIDSTNLHAAIKAFRVLYNQEPVISTADRFHDVEGSTVFGSCPVTQVRRSLVLFEAGVSGWRARIADIPYFWFNSPRETY